jgi:hypothetical protein
VAVRPGTSPDNGTEMPKLVKKVLLVTLALLATACASTSGTPAPRSQADPPGTCWTCN